MTVEPDDPHRLLVEKIQNGIDYERSCQALFSQFHPTLLRFFKQKGNGPDDCEDLTQLTFIRVFHGIGSFHFESRFSYWIFEIATRVFYNEHRRMTTKKRRVFAEPLDDLSEGRVDSDLADLLNAGSTAQDPFVGMAQKEVHRALQSALVGIPPQMRRCIALRLNGYKYREIAELMKISIDTVKAHLHQARARLQDPLTERLRRLSPAPKTPLARLTRGHRLSRQRRRKTP